MRDDFARLCLRSPRAVTAFSLVSPWVVGGNLISQRRRDMVLLWAHSRALRLVRARLEKPFHRLQHGGVAAGRGHDPRFPRRGLRRLGLVAWIRRRRRG